MTARLKVLYLANGFPSESDPWKTIYNLRTVKQLSKHADVTVFTLRTWRPGRQLIDMYEYDGVVVHRIAIPSVPYASKVIPFSRTGTVHGITSTLAIRLARRYMPADLARYDLLHAVSLSIGSWVASEWCQIAKIPFVMQAIGTDVNVILPKVIFCPSIRQCMSRAVGTICNSKHLAAAYSQLCPDNRNVSVIYRGTDLSGFIPSTYSGVTNETVFLYAGGFPLQKAFGPVSLDVKGGYTILNAWQNSEADLVAAGARLNIAGPGTPSDTLSKWHAKLKFPDRVTFMGTISFHEMAERLRLTDVVLIPSQHEGLPNIGMEAMASGLPVFGSNVGGIPELIDDGITGRLLPFGDSASWAKAMLKAAYSREANVTMGTAARLRAETMFDGSQYGKNVNSFYSAMTSQDLWRRRN